MREVYDAARPAGPQTRSAFQACELVRLYGAQARDLRRRADPDCRQRRRGGTPAWPARRWAGVAMYGRAAPCALRRRSGCCKHQAASWWV